MSSRWGSLMAHRRPVRRWKTDAKTPLARRRQ